MASLEPETLAPGHGFLIMGTDRVKQALMDTAEFLESIHDQTLALMNRGVSLDTVLHTVKSPKHLSTRPYLQPVYDEMEFIVRNIWRFYGGWYDGTPSHLKPAPEKTQADEIVKLAGGPEKLTARAEELSAEGDHRMACHLADWAYLATPEDPSVQESVYRIYTSRAQVETSTMAKGLFQSAAGDAGKKLNEEKPAAGVIQSQINQKKGT